MRSLIILMIAILTFSSVTGVNMSFAPGVNIKNVFMYILLTGMMIRFAVQRDFKLEMPGLQLCFAIFILYAILTFLVGAFIVDYPRYPVIQTAMVLVRTLVDPVLFFLVVFYGVRNANDALAALRAFLIIFTIANALTITDVVGLTSFGVEIGAGGAEDNRVFGFFGHANETGTMLAFLMPMLAALGLAARGRARMGWFLAAGISAIVFLLNGSRGALVGLVIGGAWGVFLCRRHLQLTRVVLGAGAAGLLLLLVLPFVSGNLGVVLVDRIIADLGSSDVAGLSSGRTDLWSVAVGHMASLPFTLITGWGYNSWRQMSFEYDNAHSHYLSLWFEFGLVGLACFGLMIYQMVRKAGQVADFADRETKFLMIGFIVGALALTVGVAFVLLIGPWVFIYAIMGAVMRIAASTEPPVAQMATAPTVEQTSRAGKFGWRASNATATTRKAQ